MARLGPVPCEAADLGRDFGATLTEAEVRHLMRHEFAVTAEDVLWRRGKLGLHLPDAAASRIDAWFAAGIAGGSAA